MTDIVSRIMDYEAGEITDPDDQVEFFAELIKAGTVWSLQGHYGRQASALIDAGYIRPDGEVMRLPSNEE